MQKIHFNRLSFRAIFRKLLAAAVLVAGLAIAPAAEATLLNLTPNYPDTPRARRLPTSEQAMETKPSPFSVLWSAPSSIC